MQIVWHLTAGRVQEASRAELDHVWVEIRW